MQKKMVQVTSLCGVTLMSNIFVLPCLFMHRTFAARHDFGQR
jgi:hypothetical protein